MGHWLGKYMTEPTQAGGVLVREGVAMDTKELCTIATGEEVEVVAAEFVGERLRLRIISEDVQLVHSALFSALFLALFSA